MQYSMYIWLYIGDGELSLNSYMSCFIAIILMLIKDERMTNYEKYLSYEKCYTF